MDNGRRSDKAVGNKHSILIREAMDDNLVGYQLVKVKKNGDIMINNSIRRRILSAPRKGVNTC